MLKKITWIIFILSFSHISTIPVRAQSVYVNDNFAGTWQINEEQSDDTDKQVEKAIKEDGGKPVRGKEKGRYRGGPKEHALYDYMSYEDNLKIIIKDPEIQFIYGDQFERIFYTDGRGRPIASARGGNRGERQDYSFASWADKKLLVEARPRDGGWITEIYTLQSAGNQLRVELQLKPSSFGHAISLVRIYDRVLVD